MSIKERQDVEEDAPLHDVEIHPKAIVEPGAKLGPGTRVECGAYIGPHVVMGEGCRVHVGATVLGHTTLGRNCEVYTGAIIGAPPQDKKHRGEITHLQIGDGNIFRELVTIHPGTVNGGGITRLGHRNLILVGVHIAHDSILGDDIIISNSVQIAGHCHIENRANFGGLSAVHHFVTVGRHAFIGGMSRITQDIVPYMISVGYPPEVRAVNRVGLLRAGFNREQINLLRQAYKALYSRKVRGAGRSLLLNAFAVQRELGGDEHVDYLCNFVRRSIEQGLHGRYLESLRRDRPVPRAADQEVETEVG